MANNDKYWILLHKIQKDLHLRSTYRAAEFVVRLKVGFQSDFVYYCNQILKQNLIQKLNNIE